MNDQLLLESVTFILCVGFHKVFDMQFKERNLKTKTCINKMYFFKSVNLFKHVKKPNERMNEIMGKISNKIKEFNNYKAGLNFITCLRHLNHLRQVLRAWWSLPWWPSWSLWSRSLSTWHPHRRCTSRSSRRTLTPPVSTEKKNDILIILNLNEYLNFSVLERKSRI